MAQPLPPRKPRRQKRGSGNVRLITPQIFFGSYLQAGFGFGFEVGFASGVVGVGFGSGLGWDTNLEFGTGCGMDLKVRERKLISGVRDWCTAKFGFGLV